MDSAQISLSDTDHRIICGVLQQWNARLRDPAIEPMTPDVSPRRYFRVQTQMDERPTVIVVLYDSLVVPEANGGNKVNSFDAFVELTRFFKSRDVAVPDLLFRSPEPPVLILEDLGDVLLADVLLERAPSAFLSCPKADYYKKAIDEIYHIQGIQADKRLFAYQRCFGGENYTKEMFETLDYVLTPRGVSANQREAVIQAFHLLAKELEEFPTVLVHRDFHSWNLMIDPDYKIRVIDFQDALLGVASYDVVGLLNDRDTDSGLGQENYISLVQYFASKWLGTHDFYEEYDRTLLQRDLKVAGRFAKLVNERGLTRYGLWIDGTLTRLGKTLERLTESRVHSKYSHLLEIVCELVPQCRAGADSPIRFR